MDEDEWWQDDADEMPGDVFWEATICGFCVMGMAVLIFSIGLSEATSIGEFIAWWVG